MPGFSLSINPKGRAVLLPPVLEIVAGPTDYPVISQMTFSVTGGLAANNAFSFGLARTTTVGVGRVNGIIPVQDNNTISGLSGVYANVDWSVYPVAAANYLRRFIVNGINSNSGQSRMRFPRGLKLLPSTSVVLSFLGLAAATNLIFVDIDVEFDS